MEIQTILHIFIGQYIEFSWHCILWFWSIKHWHLAPHGWLVKKFCILITKSRRETCFTIFKMAGHSKDIIFHKILRLISQKIAFWMILLGHLTLNLKKIKLEHWNWSWEVPIIATEVSNAPNESWDSLLSGIVKNIEICSANPEL